MEAPKTVNWSANALLMIADLYDYLLELSDDFSADDYVQELLDFGEQLSLKSEHYSYCRNPRLMNKGYRCALFRKKYILIYHSTESSVDILAVLHARRDPKDFEAI